MSATIKDVAKAVNVSPSTVSRVIAGNSRISDETREKVFSAIKDLNYHPNIIARSLANRATKILGLIIPNTAEELFKNPFFIQAMTGISVYAQKKGYYIMYTFSRMENEEIKFIKSYSNSKLVDGFILLTSNENDKCIHYLQQNEYPFVVIGRPESTNDVLWVDNDNFQAMYNVVNTIIKKGHKEVAFIGGPCNMNMSKDRLDGYKRALLVHGMTIDEKLIAQQVDFSEDSGYRGIKSILSYKVPDAVVTTDDLIAYGVRKAINESSDIKIALAGFNNAPFDEYQSPALSSVDVNAGKLGYYAAKLLIGKLEEGEVSVNHYIVETSFIERESTLNY